MVNVCAERAKTVGREDATDRIRLDAVSSAQFLPELGALLRLGGHAR